MRRDGGGRALEPPQGAGHCYSRQVIRELGTGTIGPRWRGCQLGVLHVLLPLPVDHDACLAAAGLRDFADTDESPDQGLDCLVGELVRALDTCCAGVTEVVARPRQPSRPWLDRFVSFRPAPNLLDLNPDRLTPAEALLAAAMDDGHLSFVAIHSADLEVQTSDGHPILWIWLSVEFARRWNDLLAATAGNLRTKSLSLTWESLVPHGFDDARVITDVGSNEVLWTNGFGVLGFEGEFLLPHPGNAGSNDPRKVYVPPSAEWLGCSPRWARNERATVVNDMVDHGWHVVELPGSRVLERQTPLGA